MGTAALHLQPDLRRLRDEIRDLRDRTEGSYCTMAYFLSCALVMVEKELRDTERGAADEERDEQIED